VNSIGSPRPFVYENDRLTCDGVDLSSLAETFGTPLYVYSAANLRGRVELLQREFAATPTTICYAVKANPALAILKLVAGSTSSAAASSSG